MFGVSVEKIQKWGEKGNTAKIVSVLSDSKVKKNVYLAAIEALSKCDNLDQDVINLVITIMRNQDKDIKLAAVRTLGNIGSSLASEHIRHLLNENDPDIKQEAKEALKKIAG